MRLRRPCLPLAAVAASLVLSSPSLHAQAPASAARPSFAEPSFSPDRSEIAFASGGDIWSVPATGGVARLLVSHAATESRPLFSPDGARLAFISTRTGNGDIYVVTLATGELRRITFDDVNDQLDGWSRDGRWLYFSSTSRDIAGMNDVYRVSAEGGTPMQLSADRYAAEYWAAPSPDGRAMAMTARGVMAGQWWRRGRSHMDESEIWLVRNVATGAMGVPTFEGVTGGGAKSAWPMWSPDGGTLYFMSDRGGAENLWSRPIATGEARQLTRFTAGRLLWPTISYDGKAIVFERDFGLWTLDLASGATKEVPVTLRGAPAGTVVEHLTLTNGLQELSLSSDGRKVAFVVRGEIFAASSKDGGDAARVSPSPAAEGQIAWSPDSRRLLYASDRDGSFDLFLYDFASGAETRLTTGTDDDVTPRWSPDGKSIAFVRGGRELRVLDVATKEDRRIASALFDRPPFLSDRAFEWSPDGRWIAYQTSAGVKQFSNIFIVAASGGEARQVSWLPNVFSGPISWSPDGTYLLMGTSQRTEDGQVARIDLLPRTPRFREDQFRDLFNPDVPKTLEPPSRQPQPAPATTPPATRRDTSAADTSKRTPARRTEIVHEDIRRRVSFLPVGIDVGAQAISPDGKSLALTASVAGQTNLYLFPLDELSREQPVARQLTSTSGFKSAMQWSPDSKELWYLETGRINAVNVETRAVRPLAVSAEMDVDFSDVKHEVFGQAWRYLRDNFYDERMHGVDWDAVRATTAPRIAGARTTDEMRRILSLMVGELNASHSGIGGAPAQQPYVGRLGVRFDREAYEGSGRLEISEILPLGPVALARTVKVGDAITAVDDRRIDSRTNLDELLSWRINRRTELTIAPAGGGATRKVTVLPVSTGTEKGLLYRTWAEDRRAYVARASGGRLGYAHMFDMGQGSLTQLYLDLDAETHARDGVVIDVRNNNGGFVNAYALDVFARRPYLTMQVRGAPATPARTQLGQRSLELPTVLVTNMHSLSDAEDFTEGYRAMGLGKVVGEPTAGWIIYTSNAQLIDGTTVRIPFIRITGVDGRNMELNPRPVDVEVVRPIGESYTGKDSQLDAAIRELLAALDARRRTAGSR